MQFAVISIVITHFNARFLYLNPPMPEKAVLTTNVEICYWEIGSIFVLHYFRHGIDVYLSRKNAIEVIL